MDSFQHDPGAMIPKFPQTMNPTPQISGGDELDTPSGAHDFSFDQYGDETNETFEERDDAKRRRIARV